MRRAVLAVVLSPCLGNQGAGTDHGEREDAIIRQSFESTMADIDFESTMADIDVVPHAIGTMPDHVHVVVSIPPKVAVADVVKRLKGASSHAVNDATSGGFAWQGELVHSHLGNRRCQESSPMPTTNLPDTPPTIFGQVWNA